jgi:hypothetical protein
MPSFIPDPSILCPSQIPQSSFRWLEKWDTGIQTHDSCKGTAVQSNCDWVFTRTVHWRAKFQPAKATGIKHIMTEHFHGSRNTDVPCVQHGRAELSLTKN